ncbi:MAG TPA: outer membrane beta-barrel protein [Blastocatellia bacterium]|nr:outer membrane beta-barrel protein [Blastocatellia bacterium]
MKKLSFLASLVVLCLPLAALAQEEAPKVEIAGGYSFVNGGGDTSHGFNFSFTGNVTKNVGIVGEFNRYTESETINVPNLSAFFIEDFPTLPTLPNLGPVNIEASLSTFLFGPRLTLIRGKKVEPFVHGLLGVARSSFDVSSPGITGGGDDNAFAFALGGGVDIKAHKNFAIRVAQLDYLGVRGGGARLNGFRYSAGVVIRLGNR